MEDNLTPMMRQYKENKAKHPDAILLFRMGDFYEMFFDDAIKAADVLDIALTTRDKNKEHSVPMCGFPHHSVSAYITKLLAAGLRVAVCDQMENPKHAKGIVKRDVTRVLTPGLADENSALKAQENHFLCAIAHKGKEFGVAGFDLSTGELAVTMAPDGKTALQELQRIEPKELLLSPNLDADDLKAARLGELFYCHTLEDWMSEFKTCEDALLEQFQVQNLTGFGLKHPTLVIALGMIINYVRQTRTEKPTHIREPRVYYSDTYMVLDAATLRNLEIFRNLRDGDTSGTLIELLDKTATPMGARMLRSWIAYPLMDVAKIKERADAVRLLVENGVTRGEIFDNLKKIADIERIAGKISLGSAQPRDLTQLRASLERLPKIRELTQELDATLMKAITEMDDLSYVAHAIEKVLVDSPPLNVREGGVIREGYNAELDELRSIRRNGKAWLTEFESRERSATRIPNLKVSYNRVFGYYIEVSKSHIEKVPDTYTRKQTLVNAERFITEELKSYEEKILNAQERIIDLEDEIFHALRTKLLEVIGRIQAAAGHVAVLDTIRSLAEVAALRGYTQPEVHDGDEIDIAEGRHPVVETFDFRETYVPNDVTLNRDAHQILIITGPNMAGKSTYMRQTALIAILSQMGGFVPATRAMIGLVDRIFTRIGAADYLAFGQSTFMVEMNETAEILHNCTPRSLVLLDEVGRGTSTFDGLSIAWAVTEHLHDKPGGGPRTLFATHYHELVDLALIKERVRNYTIDVREWEDRIVFLRKIIPGGSNRSYGIHVARLAGIPASVTDRAREILANLEKDEIDIKGRPKLSAKRSERKKSTSDVRQFELFGAPDDDELRKELEQLEIENLTPLDALNLLAEWKKRFQSRLE